MTNAVIPRRHVIPQITATAKTSSGEERAKLQCSPDGPFDDRHQDPSAADHQAIIARPKIQVASFTTQTNPGLAP